jgi:chemotaxis protein histidine kinase CheA
VLLGIKGAVEAIDLAEQMFVEASPIGRAAMQQITVNRTDVARLCELVADNTEELGELATRLASRPFGEAVATLADRVPTWAEAERKRARLEVNGKDVLVPPSLARVLTGVLVHLVRNAVAHGIEPITERERAGKPPVGVVHVFCQTGDQGPTVVVEDDGCGIDMENEASGTRPASESESIFLPGFSTAPKNTDLAGRGVGLAAVRAELREAGYHVLVRSEMGKGARFELSPTSRGGAMDERVGGRGAWRKTTDASS